MGAPTAVEPIRDNSGGGMSRSIFGRLRGRFAALGAIRTGRPHKTESAFRIVRLSNPVRSAIRPTDMYAEYRPFGSREYAMCFTMHIATRTSASEYGGFGS